MNCRVVLDFFKRSLYVFKFSLYFVGLFLFCGLLSLVLLKFLGFEQLFEFGGEFLYSAAELVNLFGCRKFGCGLLLGGLFGRLFELLVGSEQLFNLGGEFVYPAAELVNLFCGRKFGCGLLFGGLFGRLFGGIFKLFVGFEKLVKFSGELLYLSLELFHRAVGLDFVEREFDIFKLRLYGVFFGSFFGGLFNLALVYLLGLEQFVEFCRKFVYLAVDFRNVFRSCGSRLFSLLLNNFFGGLFGSFSTLFGSFFNFLGGLFSLLNLVESGAHVGKLALHCGKFIVHALEHGVGGGSNLPRNAFRNLLKAFVVYYYIVIFLGGLFSGCGSSLCAFSNFFLAAAELFAYAVHNGVVVDFGCGYGGEHRGGNLVGNVVCVYFRQVVGNSRGGLVGDGFFADAVFAERFRYHSGHLVVGGACILCGGVRCCHFVCGGGILFGQFCNYEVVIQIFHNGLGKRTATFVVDDDVEIVGRKRADLACNFVGHCIVIGRRNFGSFFNLGLFFVCGKFFGYAVCKLVIVKLGIGINDARLLRSLAFGQNNLLCNLGRNVIGRDDFLGRQTVCHLLGKFVVVDCRGNESLFLQLAADVVSKHVVVYVTFGNGELFAAFALFHGGRSNLVIERGNIFCDGFGRGSKLFVIDGVCIYLFAEPLFEGGYHSGKL